MLGNIINSVKGQLTGELQDKFKLDPQQANQSVHLARNHVEEGLKKEATGGGAGGIMNLLKGQKAPQDSPAMNSTIQKYLGDPTSKAGIPESVAQQVAETKEAIPSRYGFSLVVLLCFLVAFGNLLTSHLKQVCL